MSNKLQLKPIGISGVAGSGKDLFFSLLKKKISVKRYALADKLKEDLSEWSISKYGIDPTKCSREEKEQIRNLMTFHANFLRNKTQGRCWIDRIYPEIQAHLANNPHNEIPVITDIRFKEFEEDEVFWLKSQLGGVLVHISQYTMVNGYKMWIQAPNESEAKQNPILKKSADYVVEWEKVKDADPENSNVLIGVVDDFLKWYKQKV